MNPRNGWRKASQGNSNCLEVKRATWTDLIMLRESEDELNPGVYITPERWQQFLESIKSGEFEPKEDNGIIELSISDFPWGRTGRSVYTTLANWKTFTEGVRQGKFDDVASYPAQFA